MKKLSYHTRCISCDFYALSVFFVFSPLRFVRRYYFVIVFFSVVKTIQTNNCEILTRTVRYKWIFKISTIFQLNVEFWNLRLVGRITFARTKLTEDLRKRRRIVACSIRTRQTTPIRNRWPTQNRIYSASHVPTILRTLRLSSNLSARFSLTQFAQLIVNAIVACTHCYKLLLCQHLVRFVCRVARKITSSPCRARSLKQPSELQNVHGRDPFPPNAIKRLLLMQL